MNDERSRILNMVASGKISVDEAEALLNALAQGRGDSSVSNKIPQLEGKAKKMPEYLRVKVESTQGDNVDIRIPFRILRAGIRLTALMPPAVADNVNAHLSEKGINLDFKNIKEENLEDLLEALSEMEINVDSATGDTVRVFCE